MENQISIEEAYKQVGYKNKYQITVFILFLFQFLFSAFILSAGPYLYQDPVFICSNGENCNQLQACKEVNNSFEKVVINEQESSQSYTFSFKLYCNREILKSFAQSSVFIGCCLGTFFFSYLVDKYGRKFTQILAFTIIVIGTLLWSFSYNIQMLIISNFITGFGTYASTTISFLILSEQSIGNFRQLTVGYVLIGKSLSQPVFCTLCYFYNNNWQILVPYFTLIPIFLVSLPNLFLIESPRFYLGKNNEKVLQAFNKYAVINEKEKLGVNQIDLNEYPIQNQNADNQFSYTSLFKFKSLRITTLSASALKFLMTFVLYGQNFSLNSLNLNIYIGGLMAGICEMIAYTVSSFFISKINRKKSILIGGIIISICCTFQVFFQIPQDCKGFTCYQRWFTLILYCLGCSTNTIFFQVISTYFPELFPTSIRGKGLGFIRAIGIAGSILSPYAVQLCNSMNVQPLILFGIIGFLSMGLLHFMKETKNIPMQDLIQNSKEQKSILNEDSQDDLSEYSDKSDNI